MAISTIRFFFGDCHGKEVLEIAEKKPVDIFLLDVEMPHLNGIETAERLLKKDPKAR